jgi:hypothetical protein
VSNVNPPGILRYLALPVVLSLAMGLLVVYDSSLASYHPLWQLTLDYEIAHNYLWTATTLALLIVIAVGANYRGWLFSQRYHIAVILLIATMGLGGLNLVRLDPPDIAVVLTTLFWLVSVLVEDRPVLVPRVIIALMLGLVWFAVGATMTNGAYIILSLPSVLSKLIIVFLLANLIATPRDLDIALKALIVVAMVSAFIAILAEGLYLLTGYTFTFDDRVDEHFKCLGWICLFRAAGLTATPQALGHLLIMGIGLTLFLQVRVWLRLLMIAVLVVGAITTLSVGVGLTVGIVLALFPIFRWPSRYPYILTAYMTVTWLGHVTGLWAWVYRAANDLLLASSGANIRVWTYRGGAELIERNPVFGIGALKQIPGSMHFTTPHNTYMQVALEMGLPAALLFISLLIYLFISCWRVAARARDATTRYWMSGLLLGFSGMLFHFISEPMYPNNQPWTYMGLMTAGIIIYGRARTDPQWAAICRARPRAQRLARTLRNAGHLS